MIDNSLTKSHIEILISAQKRIESLENELIKKNNLIRMLKNRSFTTLQNFYNCDDNGDNKFISKCIDNFENFDNVEDVIKHSFIFKLKNKFDFPDYGKIIIFKDYNDRIIHGYYSLEYFNLNFSDPNLMITIEKIPCNNFPNSLITKLKTIGSYWYLEKEILLQNLLNFNENLDCQYFFKAIYNFNKIVNQIEDINQENKKTNTTRNNIAGNNTTANNITETNTTETNTTKNIVLFVKGIIYCKHYKNIVVTREDIIEFLNRYDLTNIDVTLGY